MTFVGEEEGGSAGRISVDLRAGDLGESVEGLAHVGGCQGDVDLEVSVEGEHGRESGKGFEQSDQEREGFLAIDMSERTAREFDSESGLPGG